MLFPGFSILPNSNTDGTRLYDTTNRKLHNLKCELPFSITESDSLITISSDMSEIVNISARELENSYPLHFEGVLKSIEVSDVIMPTNDISDNSIVLNIENVAYKKDDLLYNTIVYKDPNNLYKYKSLFSENITITTSDNVILLDIPDLSSNSELITIIKDPDTQIINISSNAIKEIQGDSVSGFSGTVKESNLQVNNVIFGLSGNVYNINTNKLRNLEVNPSGTLDLNINDNIINISCYDLINDGGLTINTFLYDVRNNIRTFEYGSIGLNLGTNTMNLYTGYNMEYLSQSFNGYSGDIDISINSIAEFSDKNYIDCVINCTNMSLVDTITIRTSDTSFIVFPVNSDSVILKFTVFNDNDIVKIL